MASAPSVVRPIPIRRWWRDHVVRTVDHVAVIEKIRAESLWSGRYAFMTVMSAGIAVLGLLLSSPAVVIGAMLISPLMGPIIGLGFGLATFDWSEIRDAGKALLLGVVLAVGFSALVVISSPLQNVTAEIAARTRPNLFDLMVALFSALAGAYAMVRGREGTVVGVAIATALMPPLAVIGFGAATMNLTVFLGSAFLFVTNLMTIAVVAALVGRFYGFGASLSPHQTLLQTILVLTALIALAVPLGLSLRQIAWEAAATSEARDVIASQFGQDARLSQIDLAYEVEPMRVTATVLTPKFVAGADAHAEATLSRLLGRKVAITIEQVRVGTGAQAEAEQLAAAQAGARANAADVAAQQLADRLAIVAGVDPEAVVIDREHRRAIVTAAALPGAGLATYRTLESRIAARASGWDVRLVPPAAPLPQVSFGDDGPDDAGKAAIALAGWGGARIGVPIGVAGADARVAAVVDAIGKAGARVRAIPGAGGADGNVRLLWLAPDGSEASP